MRLISEMQLLATTEEIYKGTSDREIARIVGVARNTVKRQRRMLEEYFIEDPACGSCVERICGCGRPMRHKGRCKFLRGRSSTSLPRCNP